MFVRVTSKLCLTEAPWYAMFADVSVYMHCLQFNVPLQGRMVSASLLHLMNLQFAARR